MKRIKRFLKKVVKKYTDFFNKYLVTNVGLSLISLIYIIFGDDNSKLITSFKICLICFIAINLLVEASFKKEDKRRSLLYMLSVLLSLIGSFVFNVENIIVNYLFVGIIISLWLFAFYQITKNKKDVSNYLCKVFFNLFKVELFTMILVVGFGIIYLIVEALIIDGYNVQFYDKIIYFIIGFYNIPFTIMSFDNVKDEIPEIIHSLIRRVLLILLDISFVVIIVYVLKILVTRAVPENQVFLVVFMLFAFMYPMIIMLGNYKGKIEEFNTRYLSIIFIAPLLLQTYSLLLRISVYGFTTSRYIGIFIIVFEAIAIFLYNFKNKKYININTLVLIVFTIILFVMPYANIHEAPICLQIMRLQTIWTEEDNEATIDSNDRQKIKDIYEYLRESDDADKYMPKYLSMEKINKYLMNTKGNYHGEIAKYYTFKSSSDTIDVADYSKIERYTYYGRSIKLDNMTITIGEKEIPIKGEINKFINNEDTIYEELIFKIPTGDAFYVDTLSFYYDGENDELENITLEGYVLYK